MKSACRYVVTLKMGQGHWLSVGLQGIHVQSKFSDCSSKVETVTDVTRLHTKYCVATLKMCQGHLRLNVRYLL